MPETEQKARQDRWGSRDLEPCSVSHMSHRESVLPLQAALQRGAAGVLPGGQVQIPPPRTDSCGSFGPRAVGTGTGISELLVFQNSETGMQPFSPECSGRASRRTQPERTPRPTPRRAVLLQRVTAGHGCRANQTGKGVRGTKGQGALRWHEADTLLRGVAVSL